MAGKPQNRRELRRQYDAAEPLDPMEDEADDIADDGRRRGGRVNASRRRSPRLLPRPSRRSTKAAKPAARMRIVWVVMNDAFKPIATFDYANREGAEQKAREMMEKGKGTHFVHKIKEAMPDDAPGLGAAIPRPVVEEKAAVVKEAVIVEDDEEADDEEEEAEVEEEDDEE